MEWIKIDYQNKKTLPKYLTPVLVVIKGCETGKIQYQVMEMVKESDCDWRFCDSGTRGKGSELNNAWDVIAWKEIDKYN